MLFALLETIPFPLYSPPLQERGGIQKWLGLRSRSCSLGLNESIHLRILRDQVGEGIFLVLGICHEQEIL
jgi:hypothetical protein